MGMYGVLWRVTPDDVRRLAKADDREIDEFLNGKPTATPGPQRAKGLRGWFNRISPITIETAEDYLDAPRGPSGAKAELNVDKAWHGLQFLFTQTAYEGAEPGCFLVKGGGELSANADDEGLMRVLDASQVAAFAAFLQNVSREELSRRHDPARMTDLDIYPSIWDRAEEDAQNRAFLLDSYEELRDFVVAAAADGDQLVIMIG